MEGTATPLSGTDVAAALGWWRDAGVDLDFSDEPQHWLAEPEVEAVPALPAAFVAPFAATTASRGEDGQALAMIGGDPAQWPASLPEFANWWLNEPSLDDGQVRGRVAPLGEAGAEWMVLVAQPEADDEAAQALLSGPEGSLLAAMLRAMGIAPEQAYIAAALPRHTPLPDWSSLASRGLGRVLAHHISLVAPQRLLVFGTGILPLLGHDPAQIAQTSAFFNHERGKVPMLGAFELAAIAARPARKAAFWQRWLEFVGP